MPFSTFSKIIVHIVGWLLLFSLIIAFTHSSFHEGNIMTRIFSPQNLLFYAVYIFFFYLNTTVLMPFLYLKRKYFYYGAIILVLLIVVYFLRPFDSLISHAEKPFNEFRPPPDMPGSAKPPPSRKSPGIDIISIILFITILSVSTVFSIIREWQSTLQRAVRAEADKAQAELSFLKAQINPHFLFNTLNNIYSLAVTKNEDTSIAIMKLSNIMRYVTDDATHDFVSLQSEVDCISDYIDLQRLRLNKKTEINFSVAGNIDDKLIAPLILIPFVENVFKYGISSHEASSVTIKLSADEKTITLFCQNKLFQSLRRIERTGIGLSNTKQRLEFLYPNKHLLNITTEHHFYTVLLTLQV
jgi:two-component system LytT family sensor kinase